MLQLQLSCTPAFLRHDPELCKISKPRPPTVIFCRAFLDRLDRVLGQSRRRTAENVMTKSAALSSISRSVSAWSTVDTRPSTSAGRGRFSSLQIKEMEIFSVFILHPTLHIHVACGLHALQKCRDASLPILRIKFGPGLVITWNPNPFWKHDRI